jgi:hypothetical protein
MLDHVIVDDAMLVMRTVDKALRARFVDQSGRTAGITINVIDRSICENGLLCSCIAHMPRHIRPDLSPIVMCQLAFQIDTLPYRGIGLKPKLIPQLALPDQNQRHWTLGIHLEIQEKADFFQHFPIKQMGLIHDDNNAAKLLGRSMVRGSGTSADRGGIVLASQVMVKEGLYPSEMIIITNAGTALLA